MIGPSLSTTSMMVFGASASAATAFIGEPLTMVAKAGPPPSAMSMPSAASACFMLGVAAERS